MTYSWLPVKQHLNHFGSTQLLSRNAMRWAPCTPAHTLTSPSECHPNSPNSVCAATAHPGVCLYQTLHKTTCKIKTTPKATLPSTKEMLRNVNTKIPVCTALSFMTDLKSRSCCLCTKQALQLLWLNKRERRALSLGLFHSSDWKSSIKTKKRPAASLGQGRSHCSLLILDYGRQPCSTLGSPHAAPLLLRGSSSWCFSSGAQQLRMMALEQSRAAHPAGSQGLIPQLTALLATDGLTYKLTKLN